MKMYWPSYRLAPVQSTRRFATGLRGAPAARRVPSCRRGSAPWPRRRLATPRSWTDATPYRPAARPAIGPVRGDAEWW